MVDLSSTLKKRLVGNKMADVVKKPKIDNSIEERPYLFTLGLNMNKFLKKRALSTITNYVKDTDDQTWGVVTNSPREIKKYVKCGGDPHVLTILERIEPPEETESVHDKREAEKSSISGNTANTKTRWHRKAKSIFGYQAGNDAQSSYIINDTEKFLAKLQNKFRLPPEQGWRF